MLLFGVQVLTGVALMTVYSPSATTAWASVWYIQTQMPAGWLVRGLHFFASDALVVLLALYLIVSIFGKAYRAPREFVWWTALCVMGLVLAVAHTGYLLPWDQDGYWGTNVRLNIVARTPTLGPVLQRLLVGGQELGHGALTRFHTLHVVVLPAIAVVLAIFGYRCRARVEPPASGECDEPRLSQSMRNGLVGALSLVIVFSLAGYTHHVLGHDWLDAPADPAGADYPARPEWYFLFLYQWLKYFSRPTDEMFGAIIAPGAIVAAFFVLPLIARARVQKTVHALATVCTVVLMIAWAGLSGIAVWADRKPDEETVAAARAARLNNVSLSDSQAEALNAADFHAKRRVADRNAKRAIDLANAAGIPPAGALAMLADDPMTVGPKLFAANCASCHRYRGHDGLGQVPTSAATSSDLGGYATVEWLRGFLADPMADRYFGLMKKDDGEPAHTKMSRWLSERRGGDDEASAPFQADLDAAAAYLADESLYPGRLAGEDAEQLPDSIDPQIARGRQVFLETCNECHSYNGERSGTTRAPEMRGYGSAEWLEVMIANPSDESRYRSRGREPAQMPSFSDRLTPHQIRMIASWLHEFRTSDRPGS